VSSLKKGGRGDEPASIQPHRARHENSLASLQLVEDVPGGQPHEAQLLRLETHRDIVHRKTDDKHPRKQVVRWLMLFSR